MCLLLFSPRSLNRVSRGQWDCNKFMVPSIESNSRMSGATLLLILFVLFFLISVVGFYCHFYQDYNRWLGYDWEVPEIKMTTSTGAGMLAAIPGHHSPALDAMRRKDNTENKESSGNYGGEDGFGTYDHVDKLSLLVSGQAYHENQVARNDPTVSVLLS